MKIQRETITKIKQIVDAESVLNYLGFNILRRSSKELRGPCKVHGGDNPTGFRFNLETKTWCCYTRHCEADGDRDLVGLVQKTTNLSFLESVQLLADLCGIDLNNQDHISEEFIKLKYEQEMQKEIRSVPKPSSATSYFPEEVMEGFIPDRSSYFEDRGFPAELLDFFQIGGTTDRQGVHRETIPVRDPDGNLLTVSARRTDSDEDPKYLLLENLPKGNTLYNLDVAKECAGGPPRTLVLVEGFVDVWTLALHGIWNAVAAMGTDLTKRQAELLSIYADRVIVMLDPDPAGQEGAGRVEKLLSFYVDVEVIKLPEGKDPKLFTFYDVKNYFGGMIRDD